MEQSIAVTLLSGLAGGLVTVILQTAWNHRQRPKVRVVPYVHDLPSYRITTEGQHAAYYVNVGVRNIGHRTAKRCEPVLTAYGQFNENDQCERERNWIPIGLSWALGELEQQPSGLPAVERSLIPEPENRRKVRAGPRYFFNLVKIVSTQPDAFYLVVNLAPHAQPTRFRAGKYCFQVTLYCDDGEWDETWFLVDFGGFFLKQSLHVKQLNAPSWSDEKNMAGLPILAIATGSVFGLLFGLVVVVPWGTFANAGAPGFTLALPLVLAFTILGAWLGFLRELDR